MVGGGNKRPQGRFNSEMAKRLGNQMSKKDFETLKRNCEAAEKDLMEIVERRKELEEAASTTEKEIQELKTKINNYQSDVEASKKMIPYKAALIKEQEQKVKETTIAPRLLQEKTKKIEAANAELEEAMGPYEEAEDNVKTLADQVKSLQGEKKKEILKKLDKFKEQRKRVMEELNKLNVELRNLEKNKTKLETKITKLKDDIETIQNNMRSMNESRKELEESAKKLKEEEGALKEDKEAKQQVYAELKSKASEFDQEEKKLNKQKVTVDNNIQTLSTEVTALEKADRGYMASLETFQLTPIPETEIEPLEVLSEEQLQEASVKELETRLNKYTQKLNREEPNLNIIGEYNQAVSPSKNIGSVAVLIGALDNVFIK